MKVVWSEDARQHLRSAYNYIRRESPQNAKKISSDITDITNSLLLNPNKYAPDKFKISNDGSYRAFEKHRYRIVYRVLEKEIRILRIRHTSMEPINY
jgi:plasmid stabilization system protein ParE